MTKIASIIPVYNRKDITLSCLKYLSKNDFISALYENHIEHTIIIVDDGSTDGTTEAIRNLFPDVVILCGNGNLWWTGAINKGVRYCIENNFDFIHTMNDDIGFKPDFLIELVAGCHPKQISGSVTLYDDRQDIIFKAGMLETGRPHPRLKDLYKNIPYMDVCQEKEKIVSALSGRSLLIPKNIFLDIGLFDAKRFPHGFADMEFCLRAKKRGYKLSVNLRSKIFSMPGDDKNLVAVLKNSSRIQFLKTFFNFKYNWHIPTMFYFNIAERNIITGLIGFSHHTLIMTKWLFLKMIFSEDKFKKILDNHIWRKN